jgi:predicted transcriptional regulator
MLRGRCQMEATTAKDRALRLVESLPDSATLEDVLYELYVLSQDELGLRELERGKTVSHEEVIEHIEEWLRSNGLPGLEGSSED